MALAGISLNVFGNLVVALERRAYPENTTANAATHINVTTQ